MNSVKEDVKIDYCGLLISVLKNTLETKGKYDSGESSLFPVQPINFRLYGPGHIPTTNSEITVVTKATLLTSDVNLLQEEKSVLLNNFNHCVLSLTSEDKPGFLSTFRHSFCKLFVYEIYEIKNARFTEFIRIIVLKINDSIYNLTGILKRINASFREWSICIQKDVVILSLSK